MPFGAGRNGHVIAPPAGHEPASVTSCSALPTGRGPPHRQPRRRAAGVVRIARRLSAISVAAGEHAAVDPTPPAGLCADAKPLASGRLAHVRRGAVAIHAPPLRPARCRTSHPNVDGRQRTRVSRSLPRPRRPRSDALLPGDAVCGGQPTASRAGHSGRGLGLVKPSGKAARASPDHRRPRAVACSHGVAGGGQPSDDTRRSRPGAMATLSVYARRHEARADFVPLGAAPLQLRA